MMPVSGISRATTMSATGIRRGVQLHGVCTRERGRASPGGRCLDPGSGLLALLMRGDRHPWRRPHLSAPACTRLAPRRQDGGDFPGGARVTRSDPALDGPQPVAARATCLGSGSRGGPCGGSCPARTPRRPSAPPRAWRRAARASSSRGSARTWSSWRRRTTSRPTTGRCSSRSTSLARAPELSVKPTQLGLDIDADACFRHLDALAGAAADDLRTWLWLDMEGSAYVDATLDLYERLRRGAPERRDLPPGVPEAHADGPAAAPAARSRPCRS